MRLKRVIMAKSDIDEAGDSSNPPKLSLGKLGFDMEDSVLDKSTENTIHSGHFMVSCVHDEREDGSTSPQDVKEEDEEEPKGYDFETGYDFDTAKKDPSNSYQFGPRSTAHLAIDSSLTKLFDCMTLAYSGKLTSPKWKNFKGIKLSLKDKIRLNNIIWREWHMQYCGKRASNKEKDIQGRRPIICQFEPPISDKTHTKPEAVVLEGKYWKRRLESVTAEYKKWRLFFKRKCSQNPCEREFLQEVCPKPKVSLLTHSELLDRVGQRDGSRIPTNGNSPNFLPSFTDQLMTDEEFVMDLSDTLFSSLNQPFPFPNPKEMSQLGNADFIQPGLIQLQPNLDEFMDTFEPLPTLQEMLSGGRSGGIMSQASFTRRGNATSTAPMVYNNSLAFGDILMDQQTNDQDQEIGNLGQYALMSESTPQPMSEQMNEPSLKAAQLTQLSAGLKTDLTQLGVTDDRTSQIINLVLSSSANQNQIGTAMAGQLAPQPLQTSMCSQQQIHIHNQPRQLSGQALPTQTIQQLFPSLGSTTTQSGPISSVGYLAPAKFTIIQGNAQISALLQGLSQNQASVQATSVQATGGQMTQHPILQSVLAQPSVVSMATSESQPMAVGHVQSYPDVKLDVKGDIRRASTGSISNNREGEFRIPQIPKTKLRNIVPAPTTLSSTSMNQVSLSTIQQNNTFLTQLLTGDGRQYRSASPIFPGTFTGPNFPLKTEFTPTVASSLPLIQPAPAATAMATSLSSPGLTFSASKGSGVTDFQKNVLLQAASQAVGVSTVNVKEATSSILGDSSKSDFSDPCSPQFAPVSSPGSDAYGSDQGSRSRHASNDSTGSFTRDDQHTPSKPFRPKNETERQQYKEHRRASHISAEQKRRFNIKTGFDTLHQLVPALNQNPNAKISKAATLQKGADYCKKLKQERSMMQDEAEVLKQEIESLNQAISMCQSQLPATGVPVTRQRADQMREMFDEYVKNRTLQNWKFWIFSIIIRPLFDSYNNMVSTASVDEVCRTVLTWLEQHCSLVALRPAVLNSLRHLSTTTSILSDPSKVPEQATQAVIQPKQQNQNNGAGPS